jgi:hypothetical protein
VPIIEASNVLQRQKKQTGEKNGGVEGMFTPERLNIKKGDGCLLGDIPFLSLNPAKAGQPRPSLDESKGLSQGHFPVRALL